MAKLSRLHQYIPLLSDDKLTEIDIYQGARDWKHDNVKLLSNYLKETSKLKKLSIHYFFLKELNSKEIDLLCDGIRNNTSLHTLSLYQNGLGKLNGEGFDKIISAIKDNGNLKCVYMHSNSLGYLNRESLDKFASLVKENNSLQKIDLFMNQFRRLKKEDRKVFSNALKNNVNITEFVILRQEIGDIEYKKIKDICKRNDILNNKNFDLFRKVNSRYPLDILVEANLTDAMKVKLEKRLLAAFNKNYSTIKGLHESMPKDLVLEVLQFIMPAESKPARDLIYNVWGAYIDNVASCTSSKKMFSP